ncbi:MAG: cytochrome c oxidase subunit II [bacterium]
MGSGAGNFAGKVDSVFLFLLITSVFFLVVITGVMIYFVIRYHRKRNPEPKDIHGNAFLEMLWTVIPTILVLAMFYFGWINYKYIREVPEDAMEIDVTAQMWSWTYEYDNGAKTDTLFVPLNRNIKLNLHSRDVLHSYYIPAFRLKFDVVPGQDQYLWFRADEVGNFDVFCAEYCGLQHSYMLSTVAVLPPEEYESWYSANASQIESKTTVSVEPAGTGTAKGAELVKIRGCIACHSTDGSRLVSTSFKGLYGRSTTVVSNGEERQLVVDESYIRRSILDPSSELVKGFQNLMPPQAGFLSNEDINAIISYLKALN